MQKEKPLALMYCFPNCGERAVSSADGKILTAARHLWVYGKYLDMSVDWVSELFLKFSHVMLQGFDYFLFFLMCSVLSFDIFYKATSKISFWYFQSAVYWSSTTFS